MQKFVSTDIYLFHKGFGWFGEVLMAKKTDMQQQVIIRASGTGCVTDKKWDMKLRLEARSFPAGFSEDEYEVIAWRGIDADNHIIHTKK